MLHLGGLLTEWRLTGGLLTGCRLKNGNLIDFLALKRAGHNTLNKIVGKNLRRLRGKLNLSQDDFADRAGIHRTYIGAIERGERNITLSTLELLAATLHATPTQLIEKNAED